MRSGAAQPGEGIVALTSGAHGTAIVEPTTPTPDGLVALAGRDSMQAAADPDGTVSLAALGLAGRTTLTALSRLEPETGTLPGLGGAPVRYFPTTELEPIVQATTGRLVTVLDRHADRHRRPSRRRLPIDRPIGDRPIRPDGPDGPDGPDFPTAQSFPTVRIDPTGRLSCGHPCRSRIRS